MNIFESKYTLGITLGLVCFQMYLTKSSVIDYTDLSSRVVASKTMRCKEIKDIKELETVKDRNCLFLQEKIETKNDEGVVTDTKYNLTLYKRESRTKDFMVAPLEILDNKATGTDLARIFKENNFSELKEVPKDGEIAVDTPEIEMAEVKVYNFVEKEFAALEKDSKNCKVSTDTFEEAEELYNELMEDHIPKALITREERRKSKDKSDFIDCDKGKGSEKSYCVNFDEDQVETLVALQEFLSDLDEDDEDVFFNSKESDGRQAILECKTERLEDKDFIEDYKCKSSDSEYVSRRTSDSEMSAKELCYYNDEIKDDIRRSFALGDKEEFDATYGVLNEATKTIDNQAVKASLLVEHNNATYVRLYEDVLTQRNAEWAAEYPNSKAAQDTMRDQFNTSVKGAFKDSKAQVQGSLQGKHPSILESYDFWGAQLSQVENGGPIGIKDNYLNENNGLLFGLDLSLTENQRRDLVTANDSSFQKISSENPITTQIDLASKPLATEDDRARVQAPRVTRRPVDQLTLDTTGRTFRAIDEPAKGLKPHYGESLNPNGPATSFMRDEPRRVRRLE